MTNAITPAFEESAVERLQAGLRGELIRPGDKSYAEVRLVWNGMIDKRPALIARCIGAGDVVDSINFARENDVRVAVRGGGGNFGVVTSFEFRLYPLGPEIYGATTIDMTQRYAHLAPDSFKYQVEKAFTGVEIKSAANG